MTQTSDQNSIFEQAKAAVETGLACILSRQAHMNHWVISAGDLMDAWIIVHFNRHYIEAENKTMSDRAFMERFGSLTFKTQSGEDVKYEVAGRMAGQQIVPALTIGQIKRI